jgi:hypothetical protein
MPQCIDAASAHTSETASFAILGEKQACFPREQAYAFAVERMASASLLPDAQEGISAFLEEFPPNHR